MNWDPRLEEGFGDIVVFVYPQAAAATRDIF